MERIDEHNEFLLSQLIDGDLPADQAAALRERLTREPALQEAYEALTQVDRLLVGQTRTLPQVDWRRFQARVMERAIPVQSNSASPKVIRLPRWARVAMPVAVAASMAWLLMLAVLPSPTHGPAEPIEIVFHSPQPTSPGTEASPEILIVQYDRSSPAAQEDRGDLQVAFPRSPELALEIRRVDEAREALPSWHLFMVNTPDQIDPAIIDDFGPPPM